MDNHVDNSKLPHGARGIDFGVMAFEVRPDGKLHIFPKTGSGPHFTFHPGTKSGFFDIHKTLVRSDGSKAYETVFAMEHEDIPRLSAEVAGPMLQAMTGLCRPLRRGWLKHRNIRTVSVFSGSLSEIDKVTSRERRKRLVIDQQKLIQVLEIIEDISDTPDGIFIMIAVRRRSSRYIGIALKTTGTNGQVVLRWIKMRDAGKVVDKLRDLLQRTALKYALSPTDLGTLLSQDSVGGN